MDSSGLLGLVSVGQTSLFWYVSVLFLGGY